MVTMRPHSWTCETAHVRSLSVLFAAAAGRATGQRLRRAALTCHRPTEAEAVLQASGRPWKVEGHQTCYSDGYGLIQVLGTGPSRDPRASKQKSSHNSATRSRRPEPCKQQATGVATADSLGVSVYAARLLQHNARARVHLALGEAVARG